MRILNHIYFRSIVAFWGAALGHFSSTWTFEVLEGGIYPTIISVFQIVLKSKGEIPPIRGMENFARFFSSSGGNLTKCDFDYWNLFQS